jgi:pyruvate/2-oxoglutarate dehydrogenase complex dihydrolipoamide acyltransferase (E2) component
MNPDVSAGTQILIPSLGVGMEEAILLEWLKQPGDEVAEGEAVAEIETDKMNVEVTSPAAGTLSDHLAAEGDAVPVGQPIAAILDGTAAPEPNAPSPEPPAAVASAAPDSAALEAEAVAPASAGERPPHRESPRARMRRRGGDEAPAEQPRRASRGEGVRRIIAERVTESWKTPHFAVTRELLADGLMQRLAELRETVPSATATDLMLRALATAVASEEDGAVDIGMAVATDRGVMIVVVQDVLSLDGAALAEARANAVERARSGRMSSTDLEGRAAATLSNLGAANVDHFTGIIPVGQTVLMTVGRARPRPTVLDGELVVRPTVFVTVNADHRVLDGLDVANLIERYAAALASAQETAS